MTTQLTKADLARVLYDWMPDGAYVSTDYAGGARRMSGADLADYLVSRAVEYPDSEVTTAPTIDLEQLIEAMAVAFQIEGWNIDGQSVDERDPVHMGSLRSLADTVAAEYTYPGGKAQLCDSPLSDGRFCTRGVAHTGVHQ